MSEVRSYTTYFAECRDGFCHWQGPGRSSDYAAQDDLDKHDELRHAEGS